MADKLVPIKYTSRDYNSIRNDLIEHAKRYYPDSYKDFNEGSFGSLMVDTVSYIGDILSFYLDYQANECFLDTSIEYNNILKLAKQLGYKHSSGRSTSCVGTFYIAVPSNNIALAPDLAYAPVLKKGSRFSTKNGTSFILTEDVNFKASSLISSNVIGLGTNGTQTTSYGIRAFGNLTSGFLRTETINIGNYTRFLKVPLSQTGVVEIISVFDSEGNEYYEVDFLSQNIIYKSVTNRDTTTNTQAKEILKPFIAPRRFTVENEENQTYLQFGASSDVVKDQASHLIDPVSSVLDVFGKEYVSSDSFDPTKILSTDKLGISPSNTSLSITYRYNPIGSQINFASDSLTDIIVADLVFDNEQTLSPSLLASVRSSIEITNEFPIKGDTSSNTVEELKVRIKNSFASQNRAVTLQDYKAMCYGMPAKYGSVKRVNIVRDVNSAKRNLNLYVLSQNNQGQLDYANKILKENLRVWLLKNKMINDTIDILDGKIVNYGINFTALGSKNKSKYDILADALEQLRKDFSIKKDFGEPISKIDVLSSLRRVENIIDVINVEFVPKTDIGVYSTSTFDFNKAMSADERFINVPDNVIMEIKFIDSDIKGTIL